MRDEQLDRLIRAADPVAYVDLESPGFDEADRELIAQILAEAPDRLAAPPRRRSRLLLRALAGAACVAALALVVILVAGPSEQGGGGSAFAAEAVKVAEANRRLLVTEEGWSIYYAQFDSPTYGEVGFNDERGIYDGGDFLDILWYPPEQYRMRTRERGEPVEIAGEQGLFYRLGGVGSEFQAELSVRDGTLPHPPRFRRRRAGVPRPAGFDDLR